MFKKGDKVKVVKKVEKSDDKTRYCYWNHKGNMDWTLQQEGTILRVPSVGHDSYQIEFEEGACWYYLEECLELVTETEKKEVVLPVVGLTPKCIHAGERIKEITGAINRFVDVGMPIPQEWVEELGELIQEAVYV